MFADELAGVLRACGLQVIQASVDGFHNPAHVRYRLGRHSPVRYYQDSYDDNRLRERLLDPLRSGGARSYVTAIYDVTEESPVDIEAGVAPPGGSGPRPSCKRRNRMGDAGVVVPTLHARRNSEESTAQLVAASRATHRRRTTSVTTPATMRPPAVSCEIQPKQRWSARPRPAP